MCASFVVQWESLPEFIMDLMMNKYGLMKLAESHLRDLVATTLANQAPLLSSCFPEGPQYPAYMRGVESCRPRRGPRQCSLRSLRVRVRMEEVLRVLDSADASTL